MLTIALEQVHFHAYHGFFPEETIIGNDFIVDIYVRIPATTPIDDLSETVNYQGLYEIVATVMKIPRALLEEVVFDISGEIKRAYPTVQQSTVTLRKMNPPMGASIRNSMVTLEKQY